MPYKNKDKVRHKFDKAQYKIKNWNEYDNYLKNRGSVTIWISEEAIESWSPDEKIKKKGGQKKYSDLDIQTGLTLRKIYN